MRLTVGRYVRRWLGVAVVTALLAVGCSASSDPVATATVSGDAAAPATTGGTGVEGSVRVEIPDPLDGSTDGSGGSQPTATDSAPVATVVSAESVPNTTDGSAPPRFSIVAQVTTSTIVARSEPDGAATLVADFTNPTEFGSPLVFRAVDGTADSAEWIEVHLPIQPNGSTGWVRRSEVELSNNPYRMEIDRAGHSLRVFYLNGLWLETTVAIGTGATPTPVGDFYLLDLLQPPDGDGPYGPYAFGLSGFSEVLTSFGGADTAIIGIHGTNDPATLGSDVSHGCVRLENSIIEQFAATLPLGTLVQIT